MVALEEVALHIVNPYALALAQKGCPVVSAHRRGDHSKNVEFQEIVTKLDEVKQRALAAERAKKQAEYAEVSAKQQIPKHSGSFSFRK